MKAMLGGGEDVAVEALDAPVAVPSVDQQVITSKKHCNDINLYILTIQTCAQLLPMQTSWPSSEILGF